MRIFRPWLSLLLLMASVPSWAQVFTQALTIAPGQHGATVSLSGHFTSVRGARLVQVSTPAAERVEFELPIDGKLSKPVVSLDLPAGSTLLVGQPGQAKILLVGLKWPLGKGARVPVELSFMEQETGRLVKQLEIRVAEPRRQR